nr:hypothetical protein [Tanacetum cinerariifolium]
MKSGKICNGSDINTMPYRIYEMLGREEMKKINKGITMINHTQAEAMGKLSNVLCQVGRFLYTMGSVLNTPDRLLSTFDGDVLNQMRCDGEIDDMLRIRLHEAGSDKEIFTSVAWIRAFNINEPIYAKLFHKFYSTYEFDEFISKLARKCRVLTEDVVRSLSGLIYCTDLDTTTLRDLIDFDGKLIQEDPQSSVPRVGIPRPPRESVQDLYNRMGSIEIRQETIEHMEYRQPYH